MCLSTVYNTAQQVLCKNVAAVTEKDGQLIFTDIMGIPTAVTGSIQRIDLMRTSSSSASPELAQKERRPFAVSLFVGFYRRTTSRAIRPHGHDVVPMGHVDGPLEPLPHRQRMAGLREVAVVNDHRVEPVPCRKGRLRAPKYLCPAVVPR